MQKFLSVFFTFALLIGSPANAIMAFDLGTEYYVDASAPAGTGDGSAANPWTTITEAMTVAVSGDNVNVAAGTYDAALGEIFPIQPPSGISLIGTDATIASETANIAIDYDLAASDNLLSGFTITSLTSGALLDIDATVASSTSGVAALELSNNHFVSLSASDWNEVTFYPVTSDRATLDAHDNDFDGVDLRIGFQQTSTGSATVSNNTFIDGGHIDTWADFGSNTSASIQLSITGNTVTDSDSYGLGVDIEVAASEVNGYCSVVIDNNTIIDANFNGLDLALGVSSSNNAFVMDYSVTNNSITDSGSTGLALDCSVHSSANAIEVNATIDSNTISDSSFEGMHFYASLSDQASADYAFLVTNNTVTASGSDGLALSVYVDSYASAMLNLDMTISGNTFTGNYSDGIELSFTDSNGGNQAGQEWNVHVDNNTITGNSDSGIFIAFEGSVTASSSGVAMVNLDFGTVTDDGANVIHSNLIGSSNYSTTGTSFVYVDNDGIGMGTFGDKSWMPNILALGNDWGTTDVESMIYHQVDAPILPLVEFDGPPTGDNFSAPEAIYDPVATEMETSVTLDVTLNDTDFDGNLDITSVVIVQPPTHGSVVNHGDGTVTYTPDIGWFGGDSIVYNISDTFGLVSNNATVGVMVNGISNTIPTANFDSAHTVLGVAVTIDVMANDTDADGDALDASSVAVNAQANKGVAVVNSDGTITYSPPSILRFGSNSTDSFTYTVNDVHGGVSNIATVEIKLTPNGSTIR